LVQVQHGLPLWNIEVTALTITHINKKKMPHLYGPAADWKVHNQYPSLKPDSTLIAQDFLRLAWEVLRRAPRYRWHYERLKLSGLLESEVFGGETFHFAEHAPRMFESRLWSKVIADEHFCVPPATDGQTLTEYADKNSGANWQVVHGTRWVKDLWGVSALYDPATSAVDIDLEKLFAPSLPHLTNPSIYSLEDAVGKRVRCEIPLEVNTTLAPHDILFRLRLDTPFEGQIQLLKKAIRKAQSDTPWYGAVNSGARLTDVGLSSAWLRAWDAAQELETHDRARADRDLVKKTQKSLFPRKELIDRLRAEVDLLPTKLKDMELPIVKKSAKPEKFSGKLDKYINVERFDNWIHRAKNYIESNDHFYRRAIAASLDHMDYVSYAPGKTLHPPTGSAQSART
jgi:hypothetical protein